MHCAASSTTVARVARPTLGPVARIAPTVTVAVTNDVELDRQITAIRERDARRDGRGEWDEEQCRSTARTLSSIATTIRNDRRADAWFAAAMVYQRCDMIEHETAALERALERDRLHCGVITRRAVLFDHDANETQADALLRAAPIACLDAQLESGRRQLAHLESAGPLRADRLRSATSAARAVLLRDSEHPLALNLLARVYLEQAKDSTSSEPYTIAEQTCDRAIESQRRRGIDGPSARALLAEAYNVRAQAQLAKGRVANALDSFRSATTYAPSAFEPWMNLGVLAIRANLWDQAREATAAAVLRAGTPDERYDAHIALGVALRGLGQIPQAESEYARALHDAPSRPEALFNLAALYWSCMGGDAVALAQAQGYFHRFVQSVEASGQQARFARELAVAQARSRMILSLVPSAQAVAAMNASNAAQ